MLIAGLAVFWRAVHSRHPVIENFIKKSMGFYSPILLCGVCFVFWSTFIFLWIFNPLLDLPLEARFDIPDFLLDIFNFIISWMAIGFMAVTFRFGFVVIKELADHYYTLNASHDHHH